jgi:hypothetical protein
MTRAKGREALAVIMLVTVCGGPLGCAIRAQPALPQAPSDEVRAQLNTIGVATGRYHPDVQLQAPTSGRGAGAAKGAGYGLIAGATPGLVIASAPFGGGCGGGAGALVCSAIILFGLGVAAAGGTVGVLGGTLYGAVAAEPASRISAAETELRSTVDDLDVQRALRDHVLRVAGERTKLKFVALEDHGATGSDYLALAMNDVDTVLEVDVSSIRLAGDGIDPPVRLLMSASARLVRTADGAELFAERIEYRSADQRKFVEWASEGSRALREEVGRGAEALADDIVQLLFQPADQGLKSYETSSVSVSPRPR